MLFGNTRIIRKYQTTSFQTTQISFKLNIVGIGSHEDQVVVMAAVILRNDLSSDYDTSVIWMIIWQKVDLVNDIPWILQNYEDLTNVFQFTVIFIILINSFSFFPR